MQAALQHLAGQGAGGLSAAASGAREAERDAAGEAHAARERPWCDAGEDAGSGCCSCAAGG